MLEAQGDRCIDHSQTFFKVSNKKTRRPIIRYTSLLIENRYGTPGQQNTQNPQQAQNLAFCKYFEQAHVGQVLQSHLNIILAKRQQFVGTKTLCMSLKSVQIGIKFQITRRMIQEHINVIMYEISLPLMLLSQSEYQLWSENPIEYVRLQVDQSNPFNSKNIVKLLVNSVCGIKTSKK